MEEVKGLVSVGIPTYNRPDGLKRTLEQICAQTYTNLEIIVSDNCSPDPRVKEIAESFVKKDSRVTYYRQKENIGANNNFNFLIKQAKGALFMWAADDDECDLTLIERLVGLISSDNGIVCVCSDVRQINENGREMGIQRLKEIYPTEEWNPTLFFRFPISNVFFAIYGLYDSKVLKSMLPFKWSSYKSYVTHSEVPFLAELALKGKIVAWPEPLKTYVIHAASEYNTEINNILSADYNKLCRNIKRRLLFTALKSLKISIKKKIEIIKGLYNVGIRGALKQFFHKQTEKTILPHILKKGLLFYMHRSKELSLKLITEIISDKPDLLVYDGAVNNEDYPKVKSRDFLHIKNAIKLIRILNLPENANILDIGGLDGYTAILLSKSFPSATIHTFEPVKQSFEMLLQNVAFYKNIQCYNFGLGSEAKELEINITAGIASSSLFPINEELKDVYSDIIRKQRKETILIKKLDDLFGESELFSLMKIDVQGFELEVLKGAKKILERTSIVVLEMQNHHSYVGAPQYFDLDKFLREAGFELFDMVLGLRKENQLYEWDGIYVKKQILK